MCVREQTNLPDRVVYAAYATSQAYVNVLAAAAASFADSALFLCSALTSLYFKAVQAKVAQQVAAQKKVKTNKETSKGYGETERPTGGLFLGFTQKSQHAKTIKALKYHEKSCRHSETEPFSKAGPGRQGDRQAGRQTRQGDRQGRETTSGRQQGKWHIRSNAKSNSQARSYPKMCWQSAA